MFDWQTYGAWFNRNSVPATGKPAVRASWVLLHMGFAVKIEQNKSLRARGIERLMDEISRHIYWSGKKDYMLV